MLGWQTIDRDGNRHRTDRLPFEWNRANRAGHELDVNTTRRDLRQNLVQFTKANQGLAADDRKVQRSVFVDERHDAPHELVAFEIADLLEQDSTTKVIVAVGVTPGTGQRTFPGDLDREKRRTTSQNSLPPAQYLGSVDHVRLVNQTARFVCICSILDGTSS